MMVGYTIISSEIRLSLNWFSTCSFYVLFIVLLNSFLTQFIIPKLITDPVLWIDWYCTSLQQKKKKKIFDEIRWIFITEKLCDENRITFFMFDRVSVQGDKYSVTTHLIIQHIYVKYM